MIAHVYLEVRHHCYKWSLPVWGREQIHAGVNSQRPPHVPPWHTVVPSGTVPLQDKPEFNCKKRVSDRPNSVAKPAQLSE